MQVTKRVTIPLTEEECEALRAAANAELRDPRDQARYLLRQALGIGSNQVLLPKKDNHAGNVLADTNVIAE